MSWWENLALSSFAALALAGCMDGSDPGAQLRAADVVLEAVSPALAPVRTGVHGDAAAPPPISGFAYTSAFGGAGTDLGTAVAADAAGNAYVTGTTALCTPSPFVFVEKVSAAATLTYAICLMPGAASNGIAADAAGNAYVVSGSTLTKINATGTALVYSVSLSPWQLTGVAVDAAGNAYVTGRLVGAGFDVVVAKVNAAATALVYGVSFGGSGDDMANGIAIDGAGNAYVTGTTFSANYPLSSAIQTTLRGGQDAFVAKLDSTGTALLYSTYLGGNQLDYGAAIAVDNAGNAYVGGNTSSVNGVESFPVTAGAAQVAPPGGGDAYVTKLNTAGGKVYATYVGGSNGEVATGIAVDRTTGAAVLTGWTQSTNFPTVTPSTSLVSAPDSFVIQLNPAGSAFSFARYLGGTSTDTGGGAAMDSTGHVYLTGATFSPVFPLPGGTVTSGDFDSYLLKLNP